MSYQMAGHDTREFWDTLGVLAREIICAEDDRQAYDGAQMMSDWMTIWGIDRPTRKRCICNHLASYREQKAIRRWSL